MVKMHLYRCKPFYFYSLTCFQVLLFHLPACASFNRRTNTIIINVVFIRCYNIVILSLVFLAKGPFRERAWAPEENQSRSPEISDDVILQMQNFAIAKHLFLARCTSTFESLNLWLTHTVTSGEWRMDRSIDNGHEALPPCHRHSSCGTRMTVVANISVLHPKRINKKKHNSLIRCIQCRK